MMWKDSYRLGVESIDKQHRELFRMTEELIQAVGENAPAEACRKALGFLKEYVIHHFRDEEAYQASIHYSGMEAHKKEHQQFTQTVLRYEKMLEDNGFDPATMKDLAGTVTAWLIYHVVDTDQKIVAKGTAAREERRFDRCVDLFSNSAMDVMEMMAGIDRSGMRQRTVNAKEFPEDIFIQIELVGELKGTAVFGFSKELALHLIRTMTMMELNEVDELVQSALCELTNISCGNATIALGERGLFCDIKPPVVTRTIESSSEAAGVSIDTNAGTLEIVMLMDDPAQQFLP
mgnify:CR=1 FL=1